MSSITLKLDYEHSYRPLVVYQVKEFISRIDGSLLIWLLDGTENIYPKPQFIDVKLITNG